MCLQDINEVNTLAYYKRYRFTLTQLFRSFTSRHSILKRISILIYLSDSQRMIKMGGESKNIQSIALKVMASIPILLKCLFYIPDIKSI